jgi:glycerol-3-phosphate cytidylyltransferase
MKRVITFGTFDLFHILQRARELGDYLIVGVSTDSLNLRKKGSYPAYSEEERLEIVRSIRVVDEVFLEEELERKRAYIRERRADLLVMGDDWKGRFDEFADICEVVYLPRTPNVSTTQVKAEIFHSFGSRG